MGKGGTKFVGDALTVRSGRKRSTYTGKELKGMMEKYLETGQHPEIERLQRDQLDNVIVAPLPDMDPHRPHIFLDVKIGNKAPVRLVVELFEDILPVACTQFRNRCLPGSTTSLVGAPFHRLLPGFAVFGGKLSASATGGIHMDSRLRHVSAGVVSVSFTGHEFALTLDRAIALDRTHQVIGRVITGVEHLQLFSDVGILSDDSPAQKIQIVKAGPTTHRGTFDSLEDSSDGKKLTAAEVASAASLDARNQVKSALEAAMGQKPNAEEPSGSKAQKGKSKLLDTLLQGLSDDSSEEGSEEEGS